MFCVMDITCHVLSTISAVLVFLDKVLTIFKADNEINIATAKLETDQKHKPRSAKPELIRNLWLRTKSASEKLTSE